MGPILLLLVLGIALLIAVSKITELIRARQHTETTMDESVVPVNLVENNDAVIVAEGRGRLVFANENARHWFGMNGGEPNLEVMADQVHPANSFLELFGTEGQASFRVGPRRVEATSHYIPNQGNSQLVVVMREMSGPTANKSDSSQAMSVVSEITQTISASLKLDETLNAILNSIAQVIPYDTGEITLWEEDLQILRPLGRGGNTHLDYYDRFEATDGVYHLDDSFSGWLARYRQPLLIADASTRADVRPKIKDYPFTSYIGIPLQVAERFIGTLELASQKRAVFNHEHMALLEAVGGQAAIAIENARLYQSQTERLAELSGLQQIAQAMGSFTDPRQMYGQLASRIAGLMNVEMCGILLYDPDQRALISQMPFHNVLDALSSMYRIALTEDSTAYKLWQTRDWWYTNNVQNDDMVRSLGLSNLAEVLGVRTTALMPMIVGNRRIGVLQPSNKKDRAGFTDDDMRLLAVFASQTAIVVENARMYNDEQRRADELGGLQQISQAIGVLHDAGELYGQISDRIAKLMNAQMCGVLLYNAERNMLEAQMPFHGISNDITPYYEIVVAPDTPLYALYMEAPSWFVNDMTNDPLIRNSGLDKLAASVGIRQTLFVPLIANNQRFGVVEVSNKRNGQEFTEEDARVLLVFATQAAVIIDNARLYRNMQMRAQESEALRRVAEIASSSQPIEQIVHQVMTEITKLFNCEVAAVALFDKTTNKLVLRPDLSYGLPSFTDAINIDIYAPGMEYSTAISKRPFLSNNMRSDGRVLSVYRAMADRFNLDSVIQIPLLMRSQGVGELTVANKRDGEFQKSDLRILRSIGVQVATAVERASLYEATDNDLRARIQELDSLSHVSNELNVTIQLDRILEVIRSEAQRTTEAKVGTVVLLKEPDEWPAPDKPAIAQRFGTVRNLTDLLPIEYQAAVENHTVLVSDYNRDPLDTNQEGMRSGLAVPIHYGGQVTGVIHIYSDQVEHFKARAVTFIEALANQAAIAVGNAVRYRQQLERNEVLKQRADQLGQIFELGRMLRSEGNLESILDAVANGIVDAVGFNVVLISLVDRDTQLLQRYAQAGIPLVQFEQMKKVSPSLAQIEVLFQAKYRMSSSFFLPSEERDEWLSADLPINDTSPKSRPTNVRGWNSNDLLLVPLRGSTGELIGIMSVDDPRDGKRPTLQVIEALEIFANQATFAVENYQLLQAYQGEAEATRRERDRLAQLHLVASEIQRAPDVPARLQIVANGINIAGWGRVSITLRDANLEPRELITAGYTPDAAEVLRSHLLPGLVWRQRLADPELRKYRIGQAYYLRQSDPWVTENKLIAGGSAAAVSTASSTWQPLDTVYLPLYGLDQNRLIGIIAMDSPTDGKPPTEASMRPIELFAAQASSAIENTRLYQEQQRSAEQEARLNSLMEAVASTLDTTEIITAVANGLQKLLPFTRMSLLLLNWTQAAFDVQDVIMNPRTGALTIAEGTPIPLDNTVTGRAFREAEGRVYHQTELERGTDYVDLKQWRASGERTSLIVPMVAGGRTVGALHMGTELADGFGFDEQLELVKRMANLTAVAIENARLFQQTIDRERFTASLGRIGQSINAIVDLESVFDTICREVATILAADGAYIWLPDGADLVGFVGYGKIAEHFNTFRTPITSTTNMSAVAFHSVQPMVSNDFREQTVYAKSTADIEAVPSAMIAVPLVREYKAAGVLMVHSFEPARQFTDDDVERASAFAAQAALALENVRLYQQTLGLTAFNESVVQSIQQGIIVLDKDTTVRTINTYLKQNYGWDDSAIGQKLFDYRPDYAEFLRDAIDEAMQAMQPEALYNVRDMSIESVEVVRNFYVYPLLQADAVNGAVVLVEDVTERAALEADLQERASELAALTEVSGQLTATLEPNAVIQLVIDQLGRVLKYDNVTLWLREGDKLVIRAAQGYAGADALKGVEVEIADSALFREIAARGQVLNIPDITGDVRFPANDERPTRSWMGVSLISKGNLSGLLVLEKKEPNQYRATQEQLGVAFANQAAVALENARLFQQRDQAAQENTQLYQETRLRAVELNQQAMRLALLNRVSTALAQSLDIENVFKVTITELSDTLAMDGGTAFMFEPDQQRGRLIVEYPASATPLSDVYISLENNPLYDALRQSMKPVSIYEVRNDPLASAVRDFLMKRGVLSTIFIPLAVGGQLLGTISINATEEYHTFTPDQLELAQTIASQAAVAVQNASLFEQSVVRTRELETLFEATQATSATLDLDEVVGSTAMQMVIALTADACVIATLDDVENRLETHADVNTHRSADEDVPKSVLSLSDYPARARAISSRQMVVIYSDDSVIDVAESALLAERGMYGRLLLPMIVRDQAIGLIVLEIADKTRRFNAAEIRLARALTSQASVAVDNARLQTETTYKLQELFVINELATALASSIEQKQIFRVIRDQLPMLAEAEIMLLAVYDQEIGEISYPVAVRNGVDMELPSHALGNDEVSYVIKRRMPLLLAGDDVQEVLRIFGVTLQVTHARSYLAIPLLTGDTIVGALALADETSTRAFGLDDQRVLTTIGSQLAVSIQNSRLFERNRRFTSELESKVDERTEELRRERDRIDFLYKITTGLTSSLDMEQVLTRALEMMASAVGADMGAILAIDSISDNLMYRATFGMAEREQDRLIQFTQQEGLAGWVIQSQKSVIVADVQDDGRWLQHAAGEAEPRSVMGALLEANEDILGVVMLYSQEVNRFSEDHLRLVTAASGQVATAMNNADLYSLIREQAERLGAMVRREQVDATKNAAIVESIADGVMVADPNGEIILFNKAAERILGMERIQVKGKDISDLSGLYAAGSGGRWLETLQSWMDDPAQHRPGDSLQEQLSLDNNRVVSVVLSPVNMGDQFLGTVSVFRDITREIEVDRMKTDFVSNVSHELRTPMTSIKGYADLLLLGAAGQVTEQQQRFLSTIKTNADRLSVLVNDLLDISRIDRGAVTLNLQPLDVNDVVSTGLAHLEGRMAGEKKDMHIVSDVQPNLPFINADFDKLAQILNNLLDNALNYTYAGGTITLRAVGEPNTVVFSISDTGIGISAESQKRVFERFFRGETEEENHLVMETSGTGLGLAIVNELVKMHRGDIWLESALGVGTTFFVRIPAIGDTTSQAQSAVDGEPPGR